MANPPFNVNNVDKDRIKNTTPRQIRDLLLPRLIAGEVDVSGLEIEG